MICVLDSDANALLTGTIRVYECRAFSLLPSPAVRTAATNTESCGLRDAAVIACSLLSWLMLPLPLDGIMPHAATSTAASAAVATAAAERVRCAPGDGKPMGTVIAFGPAAKRARALGALAADHHDRLSRGLVRAAGRLDGQANHVSR